MVDDGYKTTRLRQKTYDNMVLVRDAIALRGPGCLPEGLRRDVRSFSDVVDIGLQAVARAAGIVIQ